LKDSTQIKKINKMSSILQKEKTNLIKKVGNFLIENEMKDVDVKIKVDVSSKKNTEKETRIYIDGNNSLKICE
jgi:hypothetical protein